ncbi:hypothetical protein RDI58_007137 [Solanum bulbocastanum]|uniref:Uncharacterized protein n=1 Tax=Solanum bulbocastanum TaxID=147425 RepID=A0AAN8TVY0_SOLBU
MKKNQSIFKSNKEASSSSKSNVVKKKPQKRKKTAPPISRTTLPKWVIYSYICSVLEQPNRYSPRWFPSRVSTQ